MNRKTKIIVSTIVIVLLIIYGSYKYIQKELLFLPKGEKINSINSPNNKNKLNIYFIDGGSLSTDSIRIEIENGEKKYNIFWCYSICKKDMEVEWLDNENVKIDDTKVNIYKDKIDKNKMENKKEKDRK